MMIRMLLIMMFPFVCFSQTTPSEDIPVNNLLKEKENLDTKRKASYNLEEIKVRWKKAALENCPGVPCVVTPPPPSFTCGTSTVSDIDGNTYNTVLIGAQCWTKENLKVTKYNDGTLIGDSTNSTWGTAMIGARTGYVAPGVTANYVGTFGYLYNWYAATDSRKLCPTGWHVPSNSDWNSLILFLDPTASINPFGLTSIAGGKMKSTSSEWAIQSTGSNNSSGFSALPGGTRLSDGTFNANTFNALFWSASEADITTFGPNRGQLFWINTGDNQISINYNNFFKSMGCSIRCLKD